MKQLLSDDDGWYAFPSHPQQHYFFKKQSLCKQFLKLPEGAHHDNDPRIHCDACEQKVRKLMAVAESIAGKKLSPRDVMNLIEALDKIDLKKGSAVKVTHGENTVAVLGHDNGKKTTYRSGIPSKKKKKKQK